VLDENFISLTESKKKTLLTKFIEENFSPPFPPHLSDAKDEFTGITRRECFISGFSFEAFEGDCAREAQLDFSGRKAFDLSPRHDSSNLSKRESPREEDRT
jgi:hypothetical protein